MTKIQTILSLFLFLIIIFSIDMIFGNPIRETFRGGGGGGSGLGLGLGRGSGLGRGLALNNKSIITNDIPSYYFEQSDYEPLFFNLFKRF